MLKYYDTAVVFQEVPDEITLAIEITSCPHKCTGCHSPWLRENIGTLLTYEELLKLIKRNDDITCVCFMGGDGDHQTIASLSDKIHRDTNLKVAMYSGDDVADEILIKTLDYYKIGSYQEKYGPLNCKTTNQKMFQIINGHIIKDITGRFVMKEE